MEHDFNNHFDRKWYAIPRPIPIAFERNCLHFLIDCGSRYLTYNAITDVLARIDHPTDLADLLKSMEITDRSLQFKELERLPSEEDFINSRGWSFDSKTLQTVLDQVPAQDFGLAHLTPVMGLREKGILLFRQDFKDHIWDQEWKYYIWDQHSVHLVDKPTTLDEIIHTLIYEGLAPNENLKTKELSLE
ncbi:hypothetical protein MMC28_009174 [Mycoblastus sanguinarius]|nr:hypothetical protein [Mycoblastus sanguinarius]